MRIITVASSVGVVVLATQLCRAPVIVAQSKARDVRGMVEMSASKVRNDLEPDRVYNLIVVTVMSRDPKGVETAHAFVVEDDVKGPLPPRQRGNGAVSYGGTFMTVTTEGGKSWFFHTPKASHAARATAKADKVEVIVIREYRAPGTATHEKLAQFLFAGKYKREDR